MPRADFSDKGLSFLEHLEELRARIIKSLIAIAIGTIIGYAFHQYPLELITRPIVRAQEKLEERRVSSTLPIEVAEDGTLHLREAEEGTSLGKAEHVAFYRAGEEEPFSVVGARQREALIYLRPVDPFMIALKAALLVGFILAMPVILWQVWAFVQPGLMPNERKLALPLIVAGTLLFPLGAGFSYFLLDITLRFFTQFIMEDALLQNDANAYLSFALMMMLAFGIIFEFPLGIILANRVGLVSVDWLAGRRAYIFLILLIAAALITPTPDAVTLLAMALPLQLLFEISLVVCRLLDRFSPRSTDDEEIPEDEENDEQ